MPLLSPAVEPNKTKYGAGAPGANPYVAPEVENSGNLQQTQNEYRQGQQNFYSQAPPKFESATPNIPVPKTYTYNYAGGGTTLPTQASSPPPNVQAPLQHYNPTETPAAGAAAQAIPLGLTPQTSGGGGSSAALEGLQSAVSGLANTPQSLASTTGETLSQFQPGQPGILRSGLGTRSYPQGSGALAGLRRIY